MAREVDRSVGNFRNQYYATFVLNLVTFVNGIGFGWLSPILPKLQSDHSPINIGIINDSEASWIVANTNIGYLIGVVLFAVLADKIGRKKSMYFPGIMLAIAWLLKICPQNIFYLYGSRLLMGAASASTFIILPIYVSEYSDECIRGKLTSSMMIVNNLGFLLAFVMGSYADYYCIAYISIVICGIFILLHISLPESPSFLLQQNKLNEAKKAYEYFKGIQSENIVTREKFLLKPTNGDEAKGGENKKVSWKDFTEKSTMRATLIAFVTSMLMQFCGLFALMSYTERTFREAGSSNLNAEISSIIVSVVQLLGAYISTSLVDRAGRKILLSLSSLTTGLFLAILAAFVYCKRANIDVSQFDWIPVVCFSGAIFCASWGILPIPFVMMSEMLPINWRAIVMSSCTFLVGIFGVFLMKFYLDLVNAFGLHSCLFIFAGCCIFETVFVLVLVPETKGHTFESISHLLGGGK